MIICINVKYMNTYELEYTNQFYRKSLTNRIIRDIQIRNVSNAYIYKK